MKTNKNWDKVPESGERINRDHKRRSKGHRQKGNLMDDYQELMREDERGPMDGTEAGVAKQ